MNKMFHFLYIYNGRVFYNSHLYLLYIGSLLQLCSFCFTASIFHVFSEARDPILILNILFFNKLRQIIPEIRSERRDLLIFIFILKTTGTFTPVHSAGYLILRNEFRSTQEVARQNIQVSFYIRSTGLWPNTWIHVSQSLAIIRNAIHILWPVNATRD
jgi:hypothetical protein